MNDTTVISTDGVPTTAAQYIATRPQPNFAPSSCDIIMLQFFCGSILHFLNVGFGVPGNILIIIVMIKDRATNKSVKLALILLAIVDTLVLLTSILMYGISNAVLIDSQKHRVLRYYISTFIRVWMFPLAIMTKTLSIFTVVSMAITRYIAVCWPFKAAKWCSLKYTAIQITIFYITGIALHITEFFEFSMYWNKVGLPYTYYGPLKNTQQYMFYKFTARPIITFYLPLLTLVILNCRLIYALRQASHRRAHMTNEVSGTATSGNSSMGSSGQKRDKKEEGITRMMVLVIGVFILCYFPDAAFR